VAFWSQGSHGFPVPQVEGFWLIASKQEMPWFFKATSSWSQTLGMEVYLIYWVHPLKFTGNMFLLGVAIARWFVGKIRLAPGRWVMFCHTWIHMGWIKQRWRCIRYQRTWWWPGDRMKKWHSAVLGSHLGKFSRQFWPLCRGPKVPLFPACRKDCFCSRRLCPRVGEVGL